MTKIILPLPPSANHIHTVSAGRKRSSEEYKAWREEAAYLIKSQWPHPIVEEDWVSVTLHVYTKPRADIDNVIKPTLDALTGIVYADDKQVKQLHVYKHPQLTNAALTERRVEISIGEPL